MATGDEPLIVLAVKRSKMIGDIADGVLAQESGDTLGPRPRPQRGERAGAPRRAINGRLFVRLGRWIDGHTVNTEKSQ